MYLGDFIQPEDELGIALADAEIDLIEQLIAMRKRRGLTQAEVAEKMGVHTSVVTQFEKIMFGVVRPDRFTIRRYAIAVQAYIAPVVVPAETLDGLGAHLRRQS